MTPGGAAVLPPPFKVRALLPVSREALEDSPPFEVAVQLEHLLDADPARRAERRARWLAQRRHPQGWWYSVHTDGWPAGW